MYLKILTLVLCIAATSGNFIKIPANVTYRHLVNRTGYVECEVTPGPESVYWIINSQSSNALIYISSQGFIDKSNTKYYVDPDANKSGVYSLRIDNLQRNDSGNYKCSYGSTGHSASIQVADPPGKPVVTASNPLVENKVSSFLCVSEGGYPEPAFSWYKDGVEIPDLSAKNLKTNGNPSSRLELTLQHTDHLSFITCAARNILESSNTSVQLNVQYAPKTEITPRSQIAVKNRRFTIQCKVSANPSVSTVQWFRGMELLEKTGLTFEDTYTLGTDSMYKCKARNSIGESESTVNITVQYAPVVTIKSMASDDFSVKEGSDITLRCLADAKPEASYRWFRDSQEIGSSSDLFIRSVSRLQSGSYKCVATNILAPNEVEEEASGENFARINVLYAPGKPSITPSTIPFILVGGTLQLTCSSKEPGNPPGSYRWYRKNGASPNFIGGVLDISKASINMTDEYYCESFNSAFKGEASSGFQLNVYELPKVIPLDSRKSVNFSEKADEQLKCSYSGFPSPSMSWYKNEKEIIPGNDYFIESTSSNANATSILKFKGTSRAGVSMSDFGTYRCSAVNTAGRSSDDFKIDVNVISLPQFTGFRKVACEPGRSCNLLCQVLSYPPAQTVSFSRNGNKFIASSSTHQGLPYQQNMIYTISTVTESDYGEYTCTAENSVGLNSTSITLVKTSVPDSPSALVLTNLTWESVNLDWIPGFDGGYEQTFTVNYLDDGKQNSANGKKIEGLKPAMNYTFTVFSTNKLGRSAASSPISAVTSKLNIPTAAVEYDHEKMIVKVLLNTSENYTFEYCVKIEGSNDQVVYKTLTECQKFQNSYELQDSSYDYYRAAICVYHRQDICSLSPNKQTAVGNDDKKSIIIGVAVGCTLALVIIIICVTVFCYMSRRQKLATKKSPPTKNTYLNPVMTSNGQLNIEFSKSSGYNINSLEDEENDLDVIKPYSESRASPNSDINVNENLEYIYAAVQKKSAEQDKLSGNPYLDTIELKSKRNINPSSTSSKNSADEFDDELPPSPYRTGDLSFLGDGVMHPYNRFPSISESGYSTPESKQIKKVVYEVIV